MNCYAVIVAAGCGARAKSTMPKQFVSLNGRAVLWHAARPFVACEQVDVVRVVVAAGQMALAADCLQGMPKIEITESGGRRRLESARGGLCGVDDDSWVIIHDGARPCLTQPVLQRLLKAALADDVGAILAMPARETIKIAAADNIGRIDHTASRQNMFLAQTPQMFRAGMLRQALAMLDKADDDAEAMERAGFMPRLIAGDAANIKITYPEDFLLAQAILSMQLAQATQKDTL